MSLICFLTHVSQGHELRSCSAGGSFGVQYVSVTPLLQLIKVVCSSSLTIDETSRISATFVWLLTDFDAIFFDCIFSSVFREKMLRIRLENL